MLSPYRDLTAAKHFLQLALYRSQQIRPRVINVDGHPAYARAITELKASGALGRRCRCRLSPYLNNILEQDHRFVKKRIAASLWFRSVDGALRTIEGYEAMNMIRKRGRSVGWQKATRWGSFGSTSGFSGSPRNLMSHFSAVLLPLNSHLRQIRRARLVRHPLPQKEGGKRRQEECRQDDYRDDCTGVQGRAQWLLCLRWQLARRSAGWDVLLR